MKTKTFDRPIVDLQAARKAAAERFYAIGMACLPEGWTYTFRKALSGRAFLELKRIEAPKPVTRKALYIWLHECAHAHLHVGSRKTRHVEEMEAEKWAHEKMREHGVPVPKAMTKRAKRYVAHKIKQAQVRGAKKIDAEAKAFAEGSYAKAKAGSRGPILLERLLNGMFNRRR
jgi:hypothetical protein